jgi:hypothetical protein
MKKIKTILTLALFAPLLYFISTGYQNSKERRKFSKYTKKSNKIQLLLYNILRYFNSERVYVFQYEDNLKMSVIYEAVDVTYPTHIRQLQDIDLTTLTTPYSSQMLNSNTVIHYSKDLISNGKVVGFVRVEFNYMKLLTALEMQHFDDIVNNIGEIY